MKPSLFLFVLVAAVGTTALPASSSSRTGLATAAYGKRVLVEDNFFDPRSMTVRRDDAVRWRWYGDNDHNVTFVKVPHGASRRGADDRREGRFRRYFHRRGVYKYVCTNHDGMVGTIYVR